MTTRRRDGFYPVEIATLIVERGRERRSGRRSSLGDDS